MKTLDGKNVLVLRAKMARDCASNMTAASLVLVSRVYIASESTVAASVPRGRGWVSRFSEFAEQASTSHRPHAAGDEAGDRWTFTIITVDGMADIQLESLNFATLNLAEALATTPRALSRTSSKSLRELKC